MRYPGPEEAGVPAVWRATAMMTVGTALSRLTGLLRVAAMTYALGVAGTRLADTYNLSNTTPNILYELFLGGVFTSVFVPVLVALRTDRSEDPSPLVSVSLLGLAIVSVVVAVAAPLVMRIYTFRIADPRLRSEQQLLATYLLRWFSPQIFFYGLAAIAQAIMNARRRFAAPMFVPVLNNLIVCATFFAFARMFQAGMHLPTDAKVLLGAGTTAGVVMQALVLLLFLRGEWLQFRPLLRDEAVRRVLRLSGFVAGYVVVNQIGLWVVLALANGTAGGVTSYTIAFMFFQLPHGLFAVSLLTALLPDLSAAAARGDWEDYRSSFATGLRGVGYLLLPAMAGYIVLAGPITRLVLAHGVASVRDAADVASVLQAFAVGLVFFSAFQLLTRCFYALHDTRTPLLVNSAATVVFVAVNLPLYAWLGVRGLALGHSISYVFGSVALAGWLARRVGGLGSRSLAAPLARIAGASAAMGVAVWTITRVMPAGDLGRVVVGSAAGTVLYLAFSQVIGIPERRILAAAIRRRSSEARP